MPTLVVTRRLGSGERGRRPRRAGPTRADCATRCAARARARCCSRRRCGSSRYAALPAFFVLYAEDSLGLGVGRRRACCRSASARSRRSGCCSAARARPERVHPLLLAGAALLGAGLLAAAPADAACRRPRPRSPPPRSAPGSSPRSASPTSRASCRTARRAATAALFFAGPRGRRGGRAAAGRPRRRAERQLPRGALARRRGARGARRRWPSLERRAAAPRRAPTAARGPPASRRSSRSSRRARAAEVARAALRHVDEVVLVDDGAPPRSRTRSTRWPPTTACACCGSGTTAARAAPWPPASTLLLGRAASARGDRGARLRRPARPRAHPRVRRGAAASRRRDRPPPRPPLHAARPPDRQTAPPAWAARRRPRAGSPTRRTACACSARTRCATCRSRTGGYDAESRHLRALLAAGRRVGSVEIPTIYDGEPSHFRPAGRHGARWSRAIAPASAGHGAGGQRGATRSPCCARGRRASLR